MHEYDELRVRIDRDAAGSYRVLATTRSAEAAGRFECPFDELEVEDFILRMGRPRGRRGAEISALSEAKRFGGALFNSLFRDEIRGLYNHGLAVARGASRGLRITLCLSGSPELIEVPWEFLFDAPDFLAISAFTPVVRYLDLPRRPRPLVVERPLRILAVVSNPADYERLDVESERANLELALSGSMQSGALELQWLEQPTLDTLLRTLQTEAFHALHYVGHGSYDRQSEQGVLLLEDHSGWGMPISGEKLGTVLHDITSLRLVVLNACEGARTARGDPFAGMAESLVQRDIPAVIAMQSQISDEAAIVFAEGFYSKIAAGSPVDSAVAGARLSMFAKQSDDIEWGTPALFMRVLDARIFELPNLQSSRGQAADDFGSTSAARDGGFPRGPESPRPRSAAAAGSVLATPVVRSTGKVTHGDQGQAVPASLGSRRHLRFALTVVGTFVLVAAAIVALRSSRPTDAPTLLSDRLGYTAAVTKLCALADSQQQAQARSASTLRKELTSASTWQQEQHYVLQEIDSRITDAANLLADVDSLEPSTAAAASWRADAATSINTTLTALDDYQLNVQNAKGEGQIVTRVAAFDHKRGQFVANAVTTRVALAHLGGPSCLAPAPALPVVGIPSASTSANSPVAAAREQPSQAHPANKHSRRGTTFAPTDVPAPTNTVVGSGNGGGGTVRASRGGGTAGGGGSSSDNGRSTTVAGAAHYNGSSPDASAPLVAARTAPPWRHQERAINLRRRPSPAETWTDRRFADAVNTDLQDLLKWTFKGRDAR